jgi:N,N'-diacetyllegionaminate synthase
MNNTNIIAELCQNHLGDRKLIKKMVEEASDAGVEYCKIQSMLAKDITFRERFEKGKFEGNKQVAIKRPYKDEYERLKHLDLTDDDHRYFIDICKENNVLPLTTVFTRNRVDFLSKLDWGHKKIKIASFDCKSKPLLKDLVDAGFDHLLISTGSTFDHEIEETAIFLSELGCKFTFFHCVSIYPTPLSEGHIDRINYLKSLTESVGFSEHSNYEKDRLILSTVAMTKNIQWIERHFTSIEKNLTKDGVVSLNKAQMKELVSLRNLGYQDLNTHVEKYIKPEIRSLVLGEIKRPLSDLELLNRDYYHGRFASKINDKIVYNWEDYEL